ncbi:SWIM zinc finger family protein [Kribbella sp. NPDC005582]|uniref:SWIM zinc finger family protein n=1 Tax=Kribbella sp. NPDC005582 TaxID=3156893 RepID=UPI0033A82DDC
MSTAQGYPAFPAQRRSTRGRSWWARAWVQALEDTSLDNAQLLKGRRYANSGHVGTITISPGRIGATVYSPDDTYEVVVRVDELTEAEWEQLLEQVAARAGHIAALLDGEMPHDLVEAAEAAGVALLPGIGDLDPSCTCDDWELPCQHAAGLAYQVAWLLDSDPFVLLHLRGRSRELLLDQLVARSAGAEPQAEVEVEVAAESRVMGELPDLPAVPPKVQLEELAVSGIEPPPSMAAGVLPMLVLDASRRARALLIALLNGTPEPQPLDEWQDAVRLAADFPELLAPLAEATRQPTELALGVQAWQYGGVAGLDVLEHAWEPSALELTKARTELVMEELEDVAVAGNRLTIHPDTQLRLDRQGNWHGYRLVDGTWTPAGPASPDPLIALTVDA